MRFEWNSLAMVATLLGAMPGQSDGLLWTLTNGIGLALTEDKSELTARIGNGRKNLLIGLADFGFLEGGYYNFGSQIALRRYNIMESDDPISIPSERIFTLLVCDVDQFNILDSLESNVAGSGCLHLEEQPLFCRRFTSKFFPSGDPAEGKGVFQINATGNALSSEKHYFILSSCELGKLENEIIDITVRSEQKFVNPDNNFLEKSEITYWYALLGMIFVYFLFNLGWITHVYSWKQKVDITLQRVLAVMFMWKHLTMVFTLFLFSLKSVGAHETIILGAYYARFIVVSIFYLIFIEKLMFLSLGYKILINEISPFDRLKANRLVLGFTILTVIFSWWGNSSVLLWILMMFLYVLITSTVYQITSIAIRFLERHREQIALNILNAPASNPMVEHRLSQRNIFLLDTLQMFMSLRSALVAYFCVAPFILMLSQVILMRTSRSHDRAQISILSDCFDFFFFAFLAYIFRARSLQKYITDRVAPRDPDDQISSTAVHPANTAQVDPNAKKECPLAVFPVDDNLSSVVSVTVVGQTDFSQPVMAVKLDYNPDKH